MSIATPDHHFGSFPSLGDFLESYRAAQQAERAKALDGLTPGDVANVKRQVTLMDGPSPQGALLDLLIAEISAREDEGSRRQIGFV